MMFVKYEEPPDPLRDAIWALPGWGQIEMQRWTPADGPSPRYVLSMVTGHWWIFDPWRPRCFYCGRFTKRGGRSNMTGMGCLVCDEFKDYW